MPRHLISDAHEWSDSVKRHERCRISGSDPLWGRDGEIPLLLSSFYLFDGAEANREVHVLAPRSPSTSKGADPCRRHCQVGSLAGAAHLSNDNAGVLRRAQREQKSRVEQKGKSSLDFDFQYEYKLRKHGLSIL